MKKLLSLILLFSITSCISNQEIIKIDYMIADNNSTIGEGVSVEVEAFDNRKNSHVIGYKKFGDTLVEIQNSQRVEKILQEKIALNLLQRGFKFGRENTLKIFLESLSYNAKSSFIGSSRINSTVKIEIVNHNNKKKFSKNYNLSYKRKHFIAPLKSTDQAIVNEVLEELTKDILSDDAIIKFLIRS